MKTSLLLLALAYNQHLQGSPPATCIAALLTSLPTPLCPQGHKPVQMINRNPVPCAPCQSRGKHGLLCSAAVHVKAWELSQKGKHKNCHCVSERTGCKRLFTPLPPLFPFFPVTSPPASLRAATRYAVPSYQALLSSLTSLHFCDSSVCGCTHNP